jgi:hypothetical protein
MAKPFQQGLSVIVLSTIFVVEIFGPAFAAMTL